MRRTIAVALNTFRAYLFTPAFFILILTLLLIPLWCSNMSGDGTAEGKFRVFVTYSFFISSIIFTVASISLSCSSISSEWKKKTLLLLDVKSIKRWEIITGKLFGILFLNIVLILVFFLSMSFSSILVARNLRENFPEYRNIFITETELLPSSAEKPSLSETPEHEPNSEMDSAAPQESRNTYAVSPRSGIKWTFTGINKSSGNINLSYRFITSKQGRSVLGYWLLTNPSIEKFFELTTNLPENKTHRFPIPSEAVSDDGQVNITYLNINPTNTSVLFPKTDFKVLYPKGNYWINLGLASVNILLLVTFICSVGIFFSCIVSHLTAVLSTSILIFISYMHDFVEIMLNSIFKEMQTSQTIGMMHRLSYPVLKFTAYILPPLNRGLPHSYIGDFLLIPFSHLASIFLRIIVLGALPLIIIAVIYLSRKELGIPNE
jgi:hypothetical protein